MVKYQPIEVSKVLQIHPHVDGGWFWSKYSVQPYIGCQYGCSYCFLRASVYGIKSFSEIVKYKFNSPQILNEELFQYTPDIITVGDYQPAESKFKLTRNLLKVCLKHHFPVLIIVKSLLVLRDIDLLQELTKKSWVRVIFSIASAGSSNYREYFEPNTSTIESRFQALNKIHQAGIYVGVSLMPVMPEINDSFQNLSQIIEQSVANGAQFIIGGGLTLLEGQKTHFYQSLIRFKPELVKKYRQLYGSNRDPQDNSWIRVGNIIKELCLLNNIDYRMNRFIPRTILARNKKIAEKLFFEVYEMELRNENKNKISKWRRAAWRIDELKEPISKFDKSIFPSDISSFINKFISAL